ncbi:unnamed protein product [Eruca vesicaria subsp. sativa]|uniref:Uncharacterized protein n=1 Tax=Eruca vesicaria subsp. sativa TaxID=29727 RepID=A0ABC8J7R1_ERUVS|nr:unnamed protein product [Eruca vesicaria subsp. sativa]
MENKGHLLPVEAWRHIQNYSLCPATGSYRETDHSYKMSIVNNVIGQVMDLGVLETIQVAVKFTPRDIK